MTTATATPQHLTPDRLAQVCERWNEAEYWLAVDRPTPAARAAQVARALGNRATLQPGLLARIEAAAAVERRLVHAALPRQGPVSAQPPSWIARKARITPADVYAHLDALTAAGLAACRGNGSRRRYWWLSAPSGAGS